jgi:hypothetical protein
LRSSAGTCSQEVGSEAGRPEQRAEPLALEVKTETRRLLDSGGSRSLPLGQRFSLQTLALDPVIDPAEETRELQIRHGAVSAQRSGELQPAAVRAHQAPDERDAARGQRIQIQCRALH